MWQGPLGSISFLPAQTQSNVILSITYIYIYILYIDYYKNYMRYGKQNVIHKIHPSGPCISAHDPGPCGSAALVGGNPIKRHISAWNRNVSAHGRGEQTL